MINAIKNFWNNTKLAIAIIAIIAFGAHIGLDLLSGTASAHHYDTPARWSASVWKDGAPVISADYNPTNNSIECKGAYYIHTGARSCNTQYPRNDNHSIDTLYIVFRFWLAGEKPSADFNVYYNKIEDEGEINQSVIFTCRWTTWDENTTTMSQHTMNGYYEAFPEVIDFQSGSVPGATCGKSD